MQLRPSGLAWSRDNGEQHGVHLRYFYGFIIVWERDKVNSGFDAEKKSCYN